MKKQAICTLLLCAALTLAGCILPTRSESLSSDGATPLDEPYVFLDAWGNEIGVFSVPSGITVGGGRVYVADTSNHRIQVFDVHGVPLATFVDLGSGEGQFDHPCGVAVSKNGDVYVADAYNHRVQKLTSDGTYLLQWGSRGSGDGQFDHSEGIAVDVNGDVYVADTDNHRVQKFAADYPTPDPVHGLALNGSFEETPDLVDWAYGGALPVTLVPTATRGVRAAP